MSNLMSNVHHKGKCNIAPYPLSHVTVFYVHTHATKSANLYFSDAVINWSQTF